MRPTTTQDLHHFLVKVFPDFAVDCSTEEIQPDTTLHTVMSQFTSYFGGNSERFSVEQLKQLGSFINEAVSLDDNLENAVATCFLEHLHQIRSYKPLAPFLSAEARTKTRA